MSGLVSWLHCLRLRVRQREAYRFKDGHNGCHNLSKSPVAHRQADRQEGR